MKLPLTKYSDNRRRHTCPGYAHYHTILCGVCSLCKSPMTWEELLKQEKEIQYWRSL